MIAMSGEVKLSIVIGTLDRCRYLKLAIGTIREEVERSGLAAEIIVVDGGSGDDTLPWLVKQKDIITIIQHNRGTWRGQPLPRRSWGYFMNLGFKCARGKYLCMLSDDCLMLPGALGQGVALFDSRLEQGEKVGAVAFYWRNWPEQENYRVGLTLGDRMFVNHGLYLNSALAEVGYAEEQAYHFYHADGDLCLKLWQHGYACIDSPASFIEHHSHANLQLRGANLQRQKQDWAVYLERWSGRFYDPQRHNIGRWIETSYQDPEGLAERNWGRNRSLLQRCHRRLFHR